MASFAFGDDGEYNYDDDYDSDQMHDFDFPEGLKQVAFSKDGTVTAANASGINDGAAAMTLMN